MMDVLQEARQRLTAYCAECMDSTKPAQFPHTEEMLKLLIDDVIQGARRVETPF